MSLCTWKVHCKCELNEEWCPPTKSGWTASPWRCSCWRPPPHTPHMSGSITSEERPGWELVWREVPFHPQVKYYRDPAFWLRYVQGWNMSWPVDYHVVPVWWSVCRKSVKLELATRFYYFELYVVILNRLIMKDIEIMGYRFKNLMKKIIRLELSKMFAFQ